MEGFLKISINGVETKVQKNSTVLQACESLGIEIPRFCYHESLSIAGNCRMCLVEIYKSPKPVASCAMPIMEDMQIFTNSPLIKKVRESVLEFLLLNHPLDCPICDQGGECDLQDQTIIFGSDRNRIFLTKRSVENKNCGPIIKTIMNRCIHCTRCVRFATEIAGIEDLGTTGRGINTEIGSYISKVFKSELSGNVVDLCPVGALTAKGYAFVSKPWELSKLSSIDLSDSVGSNTFIYTRGKEIIRILPRYNKEINEEWLTDKSRFAFDGLNIQRLYKPYVKKNKKLSSCSWEEALIKGGKILRTCDGNQIKGIIGKSVDTFSSLALQNLFTKLGSPHLSQEEGLNHFNIDSRKNYLFHTGFTNIEKADLCLLIGVDTRMEASLLNLKLRRHFLKGNIIVGNIGTASNLTFPHHHLGTSLKTLIKVLEGKDSFSRLLVKAKNPLIILGKHALTSSKSEILAFLSSFRKQEKFKNLYPNLLVTGANEIGQLDLGISKQISSKEKILYLLESNFSSPNSSFLIYQGHHGEKSAKKADLIYPGATFTEKIGLYVNNEGRPQETKVFFPGLDLAREDYLIILALSDIMGNAFCLSYRRVRDFKRELMKRSPSFNKKNKIIYSKINLFSPEESKFSSFYISPKPLGKKIFDFYKTDSLCRASRIMSNCSSYHKKKYNHFPFV